MMFPSIGPTNTKTCPTRIKVRNTLDYPMGRNDTMMVPNNRVRLEDMDARLIKRAVIVVENDIPANSWGYVKLKSAEFHLEES